VFSDALKGSWANTIGVYDQGLVNIAASYGLSPEQYTAQTGTADQVAQQYTASTAPQSGSIISFLTASTILPGVPNAMIFGLGIGAIFLIRDKSKK
jgi:hypothetical protein